MRHVRAISILLALAMLATACGSRLSDERLSIATQRALGGAGVRDTTVATGPDGAAAEDTAAPADSVETVSGVAAEGSTSSDPSTGSPGTPDGQGSATTGEPAGPTGTQDEGSAPADTRAMPPGGNGGATDVGVTETQFFISNVSDISGPVPGLFEEASIATKAAIEWFKATEGTIYGRTPVYRPYDAKMDTGANRAAYQDACAKTFAAVGSWSAFDQGVTPVVKECGIPDLRTVALTPGLQGLDNMISADVMKPYHQPVSAYLWLKEAKPDVIDNAAYLYIAGEVTEYNSGMERDATEKIGIEWKYVQAIEISESNYAPYVLDMKSKGIEHVSFMGAYQQGVKLAKAMRQQGYWPESVMFQANVYHQDFLELGGEAVEGVVVPIVSYPLEELDRNAEAQEYAAWYERVAPGKSPTAMGMYTWGMTKLFFEAVKAAGPDLTRPEILEFVRTHTDYTGNGLFPPQNFRTKVPNDCNLLTEVRDGRFVREYPAEGYFCEGGAYDLTPS